MIASVYIKDGNINFYNENNSLSNIGGISYELGRPLLNFLCYEQERLDEGLSEIAEAFEFLNANTDLLKSKPVLSEMITDLQMKEIYVYFYVIELINKIALGETAKSVVAKLSDDFREKRAFMVSEIEVLLQFRKLEKDATAMEYLYWLDEFNKKQIGRLIYLENSFNSFYGITKPPEIVQFYEIHTIDDLIRFEFIKMIEHDIFIKKCKNCSNFFMPRRRVDAEYCDRNFGENGRRCSEVGAILRYERKVSENPILTAHKKAYRRFNSRVRTKKMTQNEFIQWADEAAKKRDECLVGKLSFNEFVNWLEQGRIRKSRTPL